MGRELIITQLADDTIFLQDEKQIPIAIEVTHEFTKVSRVSLNFWLSNNVVKPVIVYLVYN